MGKQNEITRRQFLRGLMIGGGVAVTPAILAACGNSSSPAASGPTSAPAATSAPAPTTAPAATAAPAATTAPAVAKTFEVTHWDWQVSQSAAIEEMIATFEQQNPNIKIKRTVNNTDNNNYANLLQLAIRGDSMPDMFQITSDPTLQQQVANGWLADLSQFSGFNEFRQSYPNPEFNFAPGTNTIDGKTFSAPFTSPDNAMWIGLWVNTKVFKDAGLVDASGEAKLPVTAEDFLTAARTITEQGGGQTYGYGFAAQSNVYHWPIWMAQLSGAPGGENGLDYRTGEYTLGKNPVYRQVVDLIGTLRDEDLILPESGSIEDEALRVLFAQNKFGMYLNGNWIANSFKDIDPNFTEYTITHVPLFGTTTPKSFFYSRPGGQAFGIAAKSPNAEAAWEWYRFMHSPEAGVIWVRGGNGLSVHAEANKPEYFPNAALGRHAVLGTELTRVGPFPALRNPEFGQVKITNPNPGIQDVMQGLYTGQIADVDTALADLDRRWTEARAQAIADAQAAGAQVSVEDWVFPDWELTENYMTKTEVAS